MSKETTTMTLDGDLADEAREAAKAAMDEADGKKTEDPVGDQKAESNSADDQNQETDDKAPDSLEIKKPEESNSDAEGDGLDMETFYAEYAEKGQLSEESTKTIVDALEKAGIKNGEALIQDYITGRQAAETTMQNQAFAAIGGQENFKAMSAWAVENLSDADVEAYNAATADPKTAILAVRGLYSQFLEATGGNTQSRQSPRVPSQATMQAGVAPIRSLKQIAELTADPRMDSDPGYRAEVEARIAASRKAGLI